jgi:hypothetical protein
MIKSTVAALALGVTMIGAGVASPAPTNAAVYHSTGSAYTVVKTSPGMNIWTDIGTYGYAPQDVAARVSIYDYALGRWSTSDWKLCFLNRGAYATAPQSSGARCNIVWQLYPRAGTYYIQMQYAWLTSAGWQYLSENIGQFAVR